MDILTVGDLHCKIDTIEEIRQIGQELSKLIPIVKPKALFLLGDLSDGHEKIHLDPLNEICNFLSTLKDACAPTNTKIYYIVGNHDSISHTLYLTKSHAFNSFKAWDGITIVDQPMLLKTEAGVFVACPYTPNGRFVEALDILGRDNWINAKAIFCHQEFLGASMGSYTSEHGDTWDTSYPQVIAGHIHSRSQLQSNILYIGTPYHVSFGESGPKSISLFSFDSSDMQETQYYLNVTQKLTIDITIEQAKTYEVPPNTRVRINLSGKSSEFTAFQKTQEFKELKNKCKVIPKITDSVVVKDNAERKNYLDIITQECEKECDLVKLSLEEIKNDDFDSK